jgi:hypothetical protein
MKRLFSVYERGGFSRYLKQEINWIGHILRRNFFYMVSLNKNSRRKGVERRPLQPIDELRKRKDNGS